MSAYKNLFCAPVLGLHTWLGSYFITINETEINVLHIFWFIFIMIYNSYQKILITVGPYNRIYYIHRFPKAHWKAQYDLCSVVSHRVNLIPKLCSSALQHCYCLGRVSHAFGHSVWLTTIHPSFRACSLAMMRDLVLNVNVQYQVLQWHAVPFILLWC